MCEFSLLSTQDWREFFYHPHPMKKQKKITSSEKTVKKSTAKKVASDKKSEVSNKNTPLAVVVQEQVPKAMTTEEYVRANQADLHDTADCQWRDDKEGDFAHKGIAAIVALDWATDSADVNLSDYREIRDEMESDSDHPITKLIWKKPKRS